MKAKILLFLLIASMLIVAPVLADDITFTTEQRDYYFNTGETAEIPIEYLNNLGNSVSGQMIYTTAEGVNSGGFTYSSSSTHSTSLTIPSGTGNFYLTGLTSDSEKVIDLDISFQYSEGGSSKTVTLGTITVHFTSDSTGMNSQNPQTSKESATSSSSSSSQSSASQQYSTTISQMIGGSSTQQASSSQQALQNNQQNYNSDALKSQMEARSSEIAEQKEALSEVLKNDDLLSKVEEKLSEEGFKPVDDSESISPESSTDGTFTKEYRSQDGSSVTLSGNIENGEVSSAETSFDPTEQESLIPQSLLENTTYQGYLKSLTNDGFASTSASINYTKSEALFNQTFAPASGEDNGENNPFINATLTNDLENVTSVQLTRYADYSWLIPAFIIILAVVLCAAGWFVYNRYFRKNEVEEILPPVARKPAFNYREYAEKLLREAEGAFEEGNYVIAYGFAGQALRVYLSNRYYKGTEMTNEEIFKKIALNNETRWAVKTILDDCAMVEFAKGAPDTDRFEEIVSYIRKMIAE
ncbi:hypothetical protein [Methanolacinia paynteri]|uniref:hypothetical protein n=1 Tax=Methanolacinia paynteri TaxID=230356 RepID=UPI001FDEB07E|nr:hypothetical protein [Methanolacinia paynteri]